jgi:hypothetical protein
MPDAPAKVEDTKTAPQLGRLAQLREEEAKTANMGQEPNTGGALSRRTKGRATSSGDDSSLASLRDKDDDKKKKK